jgi:DNA polymerase-3 subunit beta
MDPLDMKFTITHPEELARAVEWAASALPAKPTNPLLGMIRIRAGTELPNLVTLSAFDMDVAARSVLVSEFVTPGDVLVPGAVLAEYARRLPGGPVQFEMHEKRLRARCGKLQFALTVTDPTDPAAPYPTLPQIPADAGMVPSEGLRKVIARVAVAAQKDLTHTPQLTALLVSFGHEAISVDATDSRRMAWDEAPWTPTSMDLPGPVLVPAARLQQVVRHLPPASKASIGVLTGEDETATLFGVSCDEWTFTTRVIPNPGSFPPYRRKIARLSRTGQGAADRDDLIAAVDRVGLSVAQGEPGAGVQLTMNGSELTVSAANGESDAVEILQLDDYPGSGFGEEVREVVFNPAYLSTALTSIGDERVRMVFYDPGNMAVTFMAHCDPEPTHSHTVMPIGRRS